MIAIKILGIIPMEKVKGLIHIGRIRSMKKGARYVLLRRITLQHYVWYVQDLDGTESETSISGFNIEEAMHLAYRQWKEDSFRTVICGFHYTLPERDEHGINALFHQMVSSYSSPNGVYFDDEIGCNCFVQNASLEARNLWNQLNKA